MIARIRLLGYLDSTCYILFFIHFFFLYNVELVPAVHQGELVILSVLNFLSIQVTTEHLVAFPVLQSRFSLVTYFMCSSVYMSIPISQFIPSPIPCWYACVFFTSVSVSPLQISSSVLFFQICFCLSDSLHSS